MKEALMEMEHMPLCSASLSKVTLPDSDEELDALLGFAVRERFARAFTLMALAAVDAGRPVDSRHLVDGAELVEMLESFWVIVAHADGDVVGSIVEAVKLRRLGWDESAHALVAAAHLAEQQGLDPDPVVREARVLARQRLGLGARIAVTAAAQILGDHVLDEMLDAGEGTLELARLARESMLEIMGAPAAASLPEEPEPDRADGRTVRRAVEKVGRNDPCPCGSGRKYKKCCMKVDQEKLRDSSHIPGVTRTEVRRNPERYLDKRMLWRMRTPELARLDASRVDPSVRLLLLSRLVNAREYDAIERFLEGVDWDIEWDDHLMDAVERAASDGDGERVRRLLALRKEPHEQDTELTFTARLLASGADPGPMMRMIEQEALSDPDNPIELAYSLLKCSPALGVLVARSACLTAYTSLDTHMLLLDLLETRDRLGLPPDDPVEPLVDEMLEGGFHEADDDEQVEEVIGELEEKAAQVRDLKDELGTARDEAARLARELERRPDPDAAPPPSPPRVADDDVEKHRRHVDRLEAEIRERNAERRNLRHELAQLRTVVTSARDEGQNGEPDTEWEPVEPSTAPVRLPVFTDGFVRSFEQIPVHFRRAVMKLAGRAAAGEHAALRSMQKLRRNPAFHRLRAGPYRVIVKPRAGTLELLDVVHRKDLEKRIRTL